MYHLSGLWEDLLLIIKPQRSFVVRIKKPSKEFSSNVLFVDGTKIRANASRNKNPTKQHYAEQLAEVDKRLDELLEECEQIDEKHSLIVNVDAVNDTSDVNQFANQITQAEEVTGKECEVGCADAGYADTEKLEKID